MKVFKRILSLFLVLAALLSTQLATSVSAATTTKKFDCDKTVTMTVKTGNKAAASPRYYCNGYWQVASSKNLDIKSITVR